MGNLGKKKKKVQPVGIYAISAPCVMSDEVEVWISLFMCHHTLFA